ncbi:MAG: hypothetical protein WCF36_18755 [Candidatus Nanopelagicales bacterium]
MPAKPHSIIAGEGLASPIDELKSHLRRWSRAAAVGALVGGAIAQLVELDTNGVDGIKLFLQIVSAAVGGGRLVCRTVDSL